MERDPGEFVAYNVTGSQDVEMNGIDLIPDLDDDDAESKTGNATNCTNIYCYSEEDYYDVIREFIYPTTFEWIIIWFYAMVFFVGLIGNILVCFAVGMNHHMRTVTNLFIVNLAIADLLVIILCLIPTVLEDVTETWFVGSIPCKAVKYLQAVSVSVSVLTLTAISVERYFAICEPMTFKGTTRRARLIISAIWIISLLIILPDLVTLDTHPHFKPDFTILLTSCRPAWDYKSQFTYQIFQMIALYCLPFCLMGFTYARIASVLWSNAIPTEPSVYKNPRNTTCNGKPVKSQAENQVLARRKVAKMLIAVVVMFGLCYLPVHLLNILRYAQVDMGEASIKFALVAHWLCYFNSAINPVIYNFMSAKFRQGFRAACCCKWFRKPTQHYLTTSTHTRYGAGSYAYKLNSEVTQTEHITLTKISSGSDENNEPEVAVKLLPTMYENTNAV